MSVLEVKAWLLLFVGFVAQRGDVGHCIKIPSEWVETLRAVCISDADNNSILPPVPRDVQTFTSTLHLQVGCTKICI